MAKTKKSSGGGPSPLLLAALAGGAILLLRGSSAAGPPLDPATGPASQGAGYNGSGINPAADGAALGPSVQPSVQPSVPGQTTGTAGPPTDKFGVPHLFASTVAQASAMDGSKGNLYKTLSDKYGLYWSEVNTLMEYDYTVSGDHTYQQVYDWYSADPERLRGWITYYNQHNPNESPIIPRA